ncbi:hypothetical protein [Gorillibacterium sp. sgz5001074]|uniref:hypothetical protein n=1 Tax=Gorillibacterium sp. sgz5001074 TaxID=3446695 RepID=UPI003F672D22
MYKSISGNDDAELFDIFLISRTQFKVHEKHAGFYRYLGQKQGLVIAQFSPTGVPYDNLNPSQIQDYKNYFDIHKDLSSVLNTFTLMEDYDLELYEQVVKDSLLKDEELKDEYERIINEENNR